MSEALPVARYEDLYDVPENMVGEILDGVLMMSPRPHPRHLISAARIGAQLLRSFDDGPDDPEGPGGWWILDEPELHLDAHVMVPDLAGWRRSRLPRLPDSVGFTLAPDWVCEVLSPSTFRTDRFIKKRIYAEQGVEHLWLVDPIAKSLEILQLQPSGFYLEVEVLQGDQKARVAPFDAVELNIARWWKVD